MFENIFSLIVFLFLTASLGEAVKCYHCFDSFEKSSDVRSFFNGTDFSDKLVRCDKNINKWNSWDCPRKWPICIVMSGSVADNHEIVRTCAEENFCSAYLPPSGVKVNYCWECNSTLCNDYPKVPDPPVEPGPLFNFNININLNVKKNPLTSDQNLEKEALQN